MEINNRVQGYAFRLASKESLEELKASLKFNLEAPDPDAYVLGPDLLTTRAYEEAIRLVEGILARHKDS